MISLKNILLSLLFIVFVGSCNSSSTDKKGANEELEEKAFASSESGNYESSIKFYNLLIKRDSMNGEYYFGRGYAYSMLFRKNEAMRDYLRSAELNYRKESAFYNIGRINNYTNDSIALVYFKKALEISPDEADIKQAYNECLHRLKENNN